MKSWRFNFLKFFFIFLLVAISLRLFYWQVLNYNRFALAASNQHISTFRIDSPRGRIFASDGNILVSNQSVYLLSASLSDIKKDLGKNEKYADKVDEVVKKIQPVLFDEELSNMKDPDKISSGDKETLSANLTVKLTKTLLAENVVWVPLADKISPGAKEKIEKMDIVGLGFQDQSKRYYPEGVLAANLLGFVGKDTDGNDQGYLGLEGYYQDQLAGQSGYLTQEVDASFRPIIAADTNEAKPKNGLDIETTIDRTVQYTVEKYLDDGAKKFGAKAASAVVMDPKTGEILAMANTPGYDPNKWGEYSDDDRRNEAVSDIYEPGSTFKIITAAAGLDSGVIKPDTICPCAGPINMSGYQVETWNNKYNPNSNMAEILEHSDNVGAAFWAQQLGKTKFLNYVKNFGFGKNTGIDLQGEEPGLIKSPTDWSDIDLVTNAFGQGISVTPLQMVAAVGAIANNGKLMQPFVAKKIITDEKEIINNPKEVRQVIKPQTASTMKELLLAAVENGEAKKIIPHGLRVAGKTGTAQIPLNGKYDPNKTVASFIGFGPVEDPRFVMIVKYVEPSDIYGADTAEPTFFKIAQDLYNYWGIEVK